MLAQSLVIIHDGSHMKEVSIHISLAATMIYCRIAKAWCKCTWAEQLASAGSYRGEILGGIIMQLILNAAASKCHDAIPLVVVNCYNYGVVSYRNEPLHPFPTNQSQADILCNFKKLVSAQPFRVRYKYVQLHANDTRRDGETVLWRNESTSRWIALQRRPSWQPIAQASVSKVLSQMSRSGSPWGGKRWRVPWGLSWRNSGAGLLLRNFSMKKESSHLFILTLSGG